MPGAMPYKHRSSPENPSLIESRCPLCGQFIAATKDLALLAKIESQHECLRSMTETRKPPARETL